MLEEEVEQVKRMITSLHNNTQDLENQVQILESRIPGKIIEWNIVLWEICSDLNKNTSLRERLRTYKVFTKDQWFNLNYHKFSIKSYVLDVY